MAGLGLLLSGLCVGGLGRGDRDRAAPCCRPTATVIDTEGGEHDRRARRRGPPEEAAAKRDAGSSRARPKAGSSDNLPWRPLRDGSDRSRATLPAGTGGSVGAVAGEAEGPVGLISLGAFARSSPPLGGSLRTSRWPTSRVSESCNSEGGGGAIEAVHADGCAVVSYLVGSRNPLHPPNDILCR